MRLRTLVTSCLIAGTALIGVSAAAFAKPSCVQKGEIDGWKYYADATYYWISRPEHLGSINVRDHSLQFVEDPSTEYKRVKIEVDGKEIVSSDSLAYIGASGDFNIVMMGDEDESDRVAAAFKRGANAVIRLEFTRKESDGMESFRIDLKSMRAVTQAARQIHLKKAALRKARKCRQ